jgi:ribosomal peptide maturation radical SAM protein 1
MDVVFAVLPFADVDRPAIGVSLLKAATTRLGFSSSVQYLNFRLAELIGPTLSTQISESLPSESLVGDWFFADMLFGHQLPHEQEYVAKILSRYAHPQLIEDICKARSARREFIEYCVERLQALCPRVVGFTTTFHQTCACLVVAQRLKQLPDPPLIIFGGANCEGEMGLQLLNAFPWIDYVCTREGDLAFPAFLQQVLRDGRTDPIPGILQQGRSTEVTTPELVRELDDLPLPDYDDYFAALANSSISSQIKPELLIESSRGCWWGAKQHCTFCGLNGDTMSFRSKSPDRVFDEIRYLSETYKIKRINCVDNILDMKFVNTLFPRLKQSGLGLELFYEIKANIRYDQMVALRDGGVKAIQPGIESFSNEVLRLMRKGCTGLQNIQLLRWSEEQGITVAWNLLAGFPNESPSEYSRTAELLPLLTHLQPPSSCSQIRLDRFSPLFTKAEQFGLRRVRPTSSYYYVYPLGRRDLARLAYFFDFDYLDGRNPENYIAAVKRAVADWYLERTEGPEQRARLDAVCTEDAEIEVTDTRACATNAVHELRGLDAQVYLASDAAQTLPSLVRLCAGSGGEGEIRAALERLQNDKLMVQMDDQYLSLAVLRERPAPSAKEKSYVYQQLQEAAPAQSLLRAG